MDDSDHEYALSMEGIEGMQWDLDQEYIKVNGGGVRNVSLRVRVDPYDLTSRSTHIKFSIQATDNPDLTVTEDARFLGLAKGQF
jgi:hypothetical protein